MRIALIEIHKSPRQSSISSTSNVKGENFSDVEIAGIFGFEDEYRKGTLTRWQRLWSCIWILFDEPYSSATAKYIAVCVSVLCYYVKSDETAVESPENKHVYEELKKDCSNITGTVTDPRRAFFFIWNMLVTLGSL